LIQLILGLGNPGEQYARTRHNAGAWLVEELARSLSVSLNFETKFHGFYGKFQTAHGYCHLLIPTTYMNKSGIAVKALAQFYKIPHQAILVAHDELDLPVGDVKLKFAGGHGGHNGLRDIIAHLNTADFYRLRFGIGHPGNKNMVVDYVLHQPAQNERIAIDQAVDHSLKVLPKILAGEFAEAMKQLHTKE